VNEKTCQQKIALRKNFRSSRLPSAASTKIDNPPIEKIVANSFSSGDGGRGVIRPAGHELRADRGYASVVWIIEKDRGSV
jgi:hypothetical protein